MRKKLFRPNRYATAMVRERLLWHRAQGQSSSNRNDSSALKLIIEAAKQSDAEAACALFTELWQVLKTGRKLDPALFRYFEPKFKKIAHYGMGLSVSSLSERRDPLNLERIFNLERQWTNDNPSRRGRKPLENWARNLAIAEKVDLEISKLAKRKRRPKALKRSAYMRVARKLRKDRVGLDWESVSKLYQKHVPFLRRLEEVVPGGISAARKSFTRLGRSLPRERIRVQVKK